MNSATQASAIVGHELAASGDVESGQQTMNGDVAGNPDNVVSDPAGVQQSMQSPFGIHQPNSDGEGEYNEELNAATHKRARDRWRDAGKKVTEKGTIRFGADTPDDSAGPSSDDTAHKNSPLGPALERHSSSLLGRSSLGPRISSHLNLSKLGRSFKDNKSSSHAFAETVKLAQQQQQANRQNAAPVLKAVPSTKVNYCLRHQHSVQAPA